MAAVPRSRRLARAVPAPLPAGLLLLAILLPACVPETRRAPPPRSAALPAARPAPLPTRAAPAARPAWQARKVVADGVETAGGRLHIVKPGETGIAIARAYGADWSKVAAANRLSPPYSLEVGDRLLLPSARAVAAMTPEERARAFKLDIDDIITGGEPAARRAAAGKPRRSAGVAPNRTPTAQSATRPAGQSAGQSAGAGPPPVAPAPSAVTPLPVLTGETPRFRWPVDGRILSGFGAKPGGRFNDGVNLKASAGAPVRAAGDGVVAYAGDAIPGFGNLVLIKHAGGWVSAYGHNEALLVARGRRVAQGEVIARAGATGAVTEPQLHFELRKGRTPLDPAQVIGTASGRS